MGITLSKRRVWRVIRDFWFLEWIMIMIDCLYAFSDIMYWVGQCKLVKPDYCRMSLLLTGLDGKGGNLKAGLFPICTALLTLNPVKAIPIPIPRPCFASGWSENCSRSLHITWTFFNNPIWRFKILFFTRTKWQSSLWQLSEGETCVCFSRYCSDSILMLHLTHFQTKHLSLEGRVVLSI